MGQYFIESEEESLVQIFRKKKIYQIINRSDHTNLIDFHYAEKALYGRVDRLYQPIVPNENFLRMERLSAGTFSDIKVFSFVADSFKKLQAKFNIKAARGEIDTEDQFLSTLKATAGYRSPLEQYNRYMRKYSRNLQTVIKNNNLKFTNFQQFIKVVMPYVEDGIVNRVFTFPAFVKSKRCSILSTGLALEIGEIDPNNDQAKYDIFYKSNNWDFFVNACNTYGFMVDANNPNRIVADIASPNMVAAMAERHYEINSTDMFLENCYDHAALDYFDSFKRFLYTIYNENRKKRVVTTTHNHNDSTKTVVHKTVEYTYEDFNEQFSDSYFLKLYCRLRFLEEESQFKPYQKTTLTSNTIELAHSNFVLALSSFEKIINKTFDYSGSLSYILDRQKKMGL